MPEHRLSAVLLDDIHRGPVRDQGDVRPDHVQGEIVGNPDTVTLGLTKVKTLSSLSLAPTPTASMSHNAIDEIIPD